MKKKCLGAGALLPSSPLGSHSIISLFSLTPVRDLCSDWLFDFNPSDSFYVFHISVMPAAPRKKKNSTLKEKSFKGWKEKVKRKVIVSRIFMPWSFQCIWPLFFSLVQSMGRAWEQSWNMRHIIITAVLSYTGYIVTPTACIKIILANVSTLLWNILNFWH